MANLTPNSSWDNVYQFETSDPIQGGPNGVDNLPHKQLLNRTQWLNDNKLSLTGGVVSGDAAALSANGGLLDVVGGKTRPGGVLTLVVRSASPGTTPATISSNASDAILQMFAGGMDGGSRRGGQIDFMAGDVGNAYAGGILFRAGRGSGGTSQPIVAALDYTGRFGLGIEAPLAALHLKGSAKEIRLSSGGWTAAGAVIGVLGWTANSTDDVMSASIDVLDRRANSSASAAADIRFNTRNSAGTYSTRMVMTSEGNLGIATSSPSGRLEVAGGEVVWGDGASQRAALGYTSTYASVRALTDAGADTYGVGLIGGGAATMSRGAYAVARGNNNPSAPGELTLAAGTAANAQISFYTGGSISAVLSSAGRFGVNAGTSPVSMLDVRASASSLPANAPALANLVNNGTSTSVASLAVIGGASGSCSIGLGDSSAAYMGALNYNHATDVLRIWAGGDSVGSAGNQLILGGGGVTRSTHPSASDDSLQLATTGWARNMVAGLVSSTKSNLGDSGLLSGVQIRWGQTGVMSTNSEEDVTFNKPFPNACFIACATADCTGYNVNADDFAQVRNVTKNGMVVRRNIGAGGSSSGICYWFAIGW